MCRRCTETEHSPRTQLGLTVGHIGQGLQALHRHGPPPRIETGGLDSCRLRTALACIGRDPFRGCASLSSLPCLPGYLCVGASRDTHKSPGVTTELCMVRLKQVLPHDREVEGSCGAPTEPPIRRCVGFPPLCLQCTHIPKCLIELLFLARIDRRPEHYLMMGA